MNILGFLTASVLLSLTPGPDILFVLTQSITRGKKAGIVFAAGLCTGLIFHTAAVSLGISVLLNSSPVAFNIMKIAGATYLIYLGIKAFIGRKKAMSVPESSLQEGGKLYRKGILMNLLNPKVLLFFIAFFPQFLSPGTLHPGRESFVLGLLFMLQTMVVFSTVAILADMLSRRLMQSSGFSFAMHIVESIIYIAIGISLFFINSNA